MKIFLIILVSIFSVSAQDLDSIMNNGAQQVRHYKLMPLIPLTPPEQLFNKSVPVLHPLPNIATEQSTVALEKRINDLEKDVTKVTIILENMQKINQTHTDKFDSVMQFIGVIISSLAAIMAALIGVYVKGRKK